MLGVLAGNALAKDALAFVLACQPENDLYRVLMENRVECVRCDTGAQAVQAAAEHAGVLILADGYPGKTTPIDSAVYELAAKKGLRLYVEFPSTLPGQAIPPVQAMHFERAVVSSGFFGASLPQLRILAINGLQLLPVKAEKPYLVAARVAGFDHAVYGLPGKVFPLLFEHPRGDILVATTQFSRFIKGRYAPQDAWLAVWFGVLGWLRPDAMPLPLNWTPLVRPAFGRGETLSADVEKDALQRGVEWFYNSKLLLDKARLGNKGEALATSRGLMAKYPDGLAPTPPPDAPVGDGSLGILEAPLSVIQADGSQLQSVARRGDCTGESAMALAFGGRVLDDARDKRVAKNLLDFYLFTSTARKDERGDPGHSAYGLVAWGIDSSAWRVANYGDDNARLMLGALATAALTGEGRWDEALMMCLLANLRTCGQYGFRGDRIDIPELSKIRWHQLFARKNVNYSPHMESWLWACYLWAYQRTGFELFYQRAETAIRMTMAHYPDGWRWMNGLAQEKARMVLPVAWLVRVKDTPEHRAWLRQAVDGVVALQDSCGAIREEIGLPGKGGCPPPRSNEAYGTAEASLIQQNGDPVADLLYTGNFAFIGLHEAAAVGDTVARDAEGKLAQFLCRIQVRSEAHPSLDGGWFRAFDFKRWEAWASNSDNGWGAWAIESGWTQGWIVSVLGLRQMKTSLWDVLKKVPVGGDFNRLRREMIPDKDLPVAQTQLDGGLPLIPMVRN